jgi:hypothetical protein
MRRHRVSGTTPKQLKVRFWDNATSQSIWFAEPQRIYPEEKEAVTLGKGIDENKEIT